VGTALRQWLNTWSPTGRLEHVLRDEIEPSNRGAATACRF
jgi:hypothetical protein